MVQKVIEVVGISNESFAKAADSAVKEAAKTIHNIIVSILAIGVAFGIALYVDTAPNPVALELAIERRSFSGPMNPR